MGIVIKLEKEKAATSAMTALSDLVAPELDAVNDLIVKQLESDIKLIPEIGNHLIEAGGKRLRPMLTLATAHMCGYQGGQRHVMLASCVEFLHTATLLHDDVVDESELRRGKPTANQIFGNQAAILVGDYLISKSFHMLVHDGSIEVLKVLSDAAVVIAAGEVLQLEVQNEIATSEDDYLRVIESKTAALFAAACEISAVLTDQPDAERKALSDYGRFLGVAFQLVDDALDYRASQAALGKTVGDDFREGKITLPVVLAWRRGDEEERKFWARVMGGAKQKRKDFDRALELMDKHGTLDDTIERARHYGDRAKDALLLFPQSAERDALQDIVDFCISRAY
ncbi:MAG: polyprenyl synthetase family protein [Alphaproteobacteria bacterium]